MFCRETVKVLRRAAREVAGYPAVLLVHPGGVRDGDAFFEMFWPDARAIADPDRELYAGFGLARARLGQVFGPRAAAAAIRSVLRGNGVGKAVGGVRTMPGAFLFRGGRIEWRHEYRHAGDHPDLRAVS
jgi:hypothetical protein